MRHVQLLPAVQDLCISPPHSTREMMDQSPGPTYNPTGKIEIPAKLEDRIIKLYFCMYRDEI